MMRKKIAAFILLCSAMLLMTACSSVYTASNSYGGVETRIIYDKLDRVAQIVHEDFDTGVILSYIYIYESDANEASCVQIVTTDDAGVIIDRVNVPIENGISSIKNTMAP